MFGLSFGKSKTKSKETFDKSESTTQQQTGTNTTTTTGSSSTTGTQSNQATGSSTTSQGSTGTQTQTGTTSSFGTEALGGINRNIGQYIDSILSGNAGSASIAELGTFDAEQFIASTMQAATASANDQLGESIRGLTTNVGGNESENSATALLANRMRNATGASLAGVQADAIKTAQDIATQRSGAVTGAESNGVNALAQILNSIKGGESTTVGQVADNRTTTGTTNTSEASTAQTSQNTQTTQTALEIINQLLSGTSNSKGTANTTGSKSGGGFSLSL